MKKIFLALTLGIFMLSCSDEQLLEPNSPTESIAKIETSYRKGDVKLEGDLAEEKIESFLDATEIDKLKNQITNQISINLKGLQDRYKVSRTIYDGYDVGVIPNANSCPSWSEYIRISMDCEDSNPATKWRDNGYVVDGYHGAWTVDGNKNVNLVFCRVDGRLFSNTYTSNDFGVLRLGVNAPAGTVGVITRYFDNEDKNNKNSYEGDIGPNVSTGNTTLQFYGFGGCCKTGSYPDFGFGYGALRGIGMGNYPNVGMLTTDEEDKKNGNWMTISNSGMNYSYITPGGNTDIYIGKIRD